MSKEPIAEQWRTYLAQVVPKDASEVQVTETRRAFYAGAAAMFTIVNSAADLAEDDACKQLDAVDQELALHAKQVMAGIR